MNKAHLIDAVSRVVSTKQEAAQAVAQVFDAMRQALRQGDKVVVSGFGSFHLKLRKPKKARNPRTGEPVLIPPRRVIKFKPAKDLLPKNETH